MLLLRLRCVVEILMFIVHWYVTSKALIMIASGIPCSDHSVESEFCSGIASLAVPIWRERFKDALAEYAKYIRISGKISIMERFMHSVTCLLHTKQANGCSLVS